MPSAAYYTWINAGRPLEPSRTIREMVERLRASYPGVLFSWYANDAHYKASNPLDHTPFSTDDWPVECPRYVVFATDVMPSDRYNLDELAWYWVAEAQAGRTPWRKYIIYRNRSWSVRSGWVEKEYTGDYHNHIHLSDRTDWEFKSIGDWNPVPPGGLFMNLSPEQQADVIRRINNIDSFLHQGLARGEETITGLHYGYGAGEPQTPQPFALNAKLAEIVEAARTPVNMDELISRLTPVLEDVVQDAITNVLRSLLAASEDQR